MIAAALLSASSSSSKSSSTMTTTTSMKTTEQQVRTLIPVTTSDGSKLFVSGPCIVLKTHTPAPTVAQQMQALRPLLKADTKSNTITTSSAADNKKKSNDLKKNSDSSKDEIISENSPGSNTENEPEALRVKRRIDFSSLGLPRPQPAAMARRNERERNRVKQVNMGFETLRQHVPQGRKNKKLSKVDTLKEAVKYIKYLHDLLVEADEDADASLTTAIADTITMTSRPTPITTSATSSPASVTAAETPSAVTTSTNTTAITTADLMQLATPTMETSTSMDFACEPASNLVPTERGSVFNIHNDSAVSNPVDFNSVSQLANVQDFEHVSPLAADSMDIAHDSPSHLVELTPAQMDFENHDCRSMTNTHVEHIRASIEPMSELSIVPSFLTANPSSLTYMDLKNSHTSSPEHSVMDVNQSYLPEFQSFRTEQGCGGSDGSCPVSPSESSGASEVSQEDALGMSGGEIWQDLSADIGAEWLSRFLTCLSEGGCKETPPDHADLLATMT